MSIVEFQNLQTRTTACPKEKPHGFYKKNRSKLVAISVLQLSDVILHGVHVLCQAFQARSTGVTSALGAQEGDFLFDILVVSFRPVVLLKKISQFVCVQQKLLGKMLHLNKEKSLPKVIQVVQFGMYQDVNTPSHLCELLNLR